MTLSTAIAAALSAVRAAYPALVCRETEGHRPTERQQALYAQGRTAPGPILTYVDGVTRFSLHQYVGIGEPSMAVDVAILDGKRYADAGHPAWELFGATVEAHGLTWGGRWKMRDLPHVEVPEAARVQALQRALSVAGESPGAIDGDLGPRTVAALTAWCVRVGLPAPRVPRSGSKWWAVTPTAWAQLRPGTW